MAEGPGNDALELLDINLAYHRMRLATPGLPVRKYRSIIPEQHILNQSIRCLGINQLLRRLLPKNMVERE